MAGPTKLEEFGVELQFEERMVLSMLLTHSEANAALLGIVRKFREELSVDEKEGKALGLFTTPDGRAGWDTEKDKPVKFKMGPSLKGLVIGLLKRADQTQAMTLPQLSLFEKFIGEVPEEGSDV